MAKNNESVVEDADPNAVVTTLDNNGNIDVQNVQVGEVDGPKFDPLTAVQHALNAEPTEFEGQIKLGLADRIQNAIERKRDEVAQAIFGPQDSEDETDDPNAEEDTTDPEAQVDQDEE